MATIRIPVDFDIVGSNVLEIADFTVEKYEFRNNTTLSVEMREEGVAKIKDALCSGLRHRSLPALFLARLRAS